jgi:hypothetical protein
MSSINFSIGGDNSKFRAVAKDTQAIGNRMAANVQSRLGTMGVAVGTFLGGAALQVAGQVGRMAASMSQAVLKAYDLGGALSDLSSQTGILPGRIRILTQAFENNGLAADDLQPTIGRMQKLLIAAAKGSDTAAEAFSQIGLNFQDLLRMSPDQQFLAIGRAINGVSDPTARAAAAMGIFGKSGGKLLTLFADTTAVANAVREIGSSADILDKKSGVFDTISDKIAKMVPAKMEGLFVGIADKFATPILNILTRIESFDFAPIGQQIGQTLMDVATQFWNFFANPGAYIEAFSFAVLSKIAGFGNELAASFRFGTEVLVATFKNLGETAIPTLGSLLTNALGAAATTFNRILINAGLDFLTTMAQIPGLADAANSGIQALIEANTKVIGDQAKFF